MIPAACSAGAVAPPAGLDIVIVTWNSGSIVQECLRSVARAAGHGVRVERVVLVDNASTVPPAVPPDLGLHVEVVRNERNRGFAAACNQGAGHGRADYLLFLNPDVVLGRDALAAPMAWLDDARHRRTGIVGIRLVDERGVTARTCARRPTRASFLAALLRLHHLARVFRTHLMAEWDHSHTREVDHVLGAFYMVRRAVFEALGGFDERFFVYFEDLDFSLRARDAGWTVQYLAAAEAVHRGGWTTGLHREDRLYHDWRSRVAFARKHFGRGTAAGTALVTALVDPLLRVGSGVRHRSWTEIQGSLRVCKSLIVGRHPLE
jgi:GT2 family glycosyltransferase